MHHYNSTSLGITNIFFQFILKLQDFIHSLFIFVSSCFHESIIWIQIKIHQPKNKMSVFDHIMARKLKKKKTKYWKLSIQDISNSPRYFMV